MREEKCSIETMPANILYFDYLAHNGIISDNGIQKKPAVPKLKKLTPDKEQIMF